MKAVILAGGLGTRLSEETSTRPKPMVEIGGQPILWHIMKMYSQHGINDFIICCGYKGYIIKEYFCNYLLHTSDITIDFENNQTKFIERRAEPWKINLVDTGANTMTGGRLLRVAEYLDDNESFCFTYGDGVSDINIKDLIKFHAKHGKQATMTAVYPPGRFGALELCGDTVSSFVEKPKGGLINGGFFVLEKECLNYIQDDNSVWEKEPLTRLSSNGQLIAYKHEGFWQPMDTLRDKLYLENKWGEGKAPWKTWDINNEK